MEEEFQTRLHQQNRSFQLRKGVSFASTAPFNTQQPKVFGVKFSLREIEKIFPSKTRNFKLWKMPK